MKITLEILSRFLLEDDKPSVETKLTIINQPNIRMDKDNHKAASKLKDSISRLVDKPVHLTITDNTSSMLTVKASNSGYHMRLHHMFLEADTPVLKSLARFITSRNRKPPSALKEFVNANSYKIREAVPRTRRNVLCSAGRYFDLKHLFDQVNREYFNNEVDCSITWGARRRVRGQNSIKLASYSETTRTIRVNPVLDKGYVPKYVIEGIIHHEMLHHYLGVEIHNGRKIAHSRTFRQLESRYQHYTRLKAWKEKNVHRLLGR